MFKTAGDVSNIEKSKRSNLVDPYCVPCKNEINPINDLFSLTSKSMGDLLLEKYNHSIFFLFLGITKLYFEISLLLNSSISFGGLLQ